MNATMTKPFGSWADFRASIAAEIAAKLPRALHEDEPGCFLNNRGRGRVAAKTLRQFKRAGEGYHRKFA